MELVSFSYSSPKPSTGRQTGIRSNAPKGPNTRAEQLHAGHLVGIVGHGGKEASEPGPD